MNAFFYWKNVDRILSYDHFIGGDEVMFLIKQRKTRVGIWPHAMSKHWLTLHRYSEETS